MNTVLWVAQVLLALAFFGAGFDQAFVYEDAGRRMAWVAALPKRLAVVLGALEMLGAVGLIVPAWTGIMPWLTATAALALAALMGLAVAYHVTSPRDSPDRVQRHFRARCGVRRDRPLRHRAILIAASDGPGVQPGLEACRVHRPGEPRASPVAARQLYWRATGLIGKTPTTAGLTGSSRSSQPTSPDLTSSPRKIGLLRGQADEEGARVRLAWG